MRKLAWACGGFSGAIFLCEYLLAPGWYLGCALACAILAGAGCFLRGGLRLRAWLALLGAAAGCLCFQLHDRVTVAPAEALAGGERTVTARVLDYPAVYEGSQSAVVRLTETGRPVRCLLTSYDGGLAELTPGDEITAAVRLRSAAVRWGQETDQYSARGIFLTAVCQEAPVRTGRWGGAFLYWPRKFAQDVAAVAARAFPEDTAPFMTALLTGDKTALYEENTLYGTLREAGLAHVVAVSGMHISFLMGFLWLVAGNRRRVTLAAVPLLALFAAMAGFTPSVLRAVFMQACFLAAPWADREPDPPTSLALALALLLALNPSAAASVSLQLSFAAAAGILLVSGPIDRALRRFGEKRLARAPRLLRRALDGAAGIASVTAGAMLLTVPVTAAQFGSISLVSPVTNLLCVWLVPVLFLGGFACVLAGAALLPLGAALGRVLAWGARYVFAVSGCLTRLPCASVYTSNGVFVVWLVFVYALLLAAWVFRDREKGFRPAAPLCLAVMGLCLCVFAVRARWDRGLLVTVLDVGQGECVLLESGEQTVVVDCGGAHTGENAGEQAAGALGGRCRGSIDALILTHLHRDHCSGAAALLSMVDVHTLYYPADADDADGTLAELLAAAARSGTAAVPLTDDLTLEGGALTLQLWRTEGKAGENERGLAVLASRGDFDVLITGDAGTAAERLLCARHTLPDVEVLVAGHHGSDTSTHTRLLEAAMPDLAVISVGYNTYGHPAQTVLDRLAAYHIEVHRTDLEGDITILGG